MADSWLNLGNVSDKFLIKPDWSGKHSRNFNFGRTLTGYPGTGKAMYGNITDLPFSAEYSFSNVSRNEEYALLSAFNTFKGRWSRFWMPIWNSYFTLASNITAGATTCQVNNILFHEVYRGYERLFIELANGDIVSRKITAAVEVSKTVERLTVETAFDRNIAVSDIACFGKLILCRFDNDIVSISYKTSEVSTYTLSFVELVKEYSLL